MPKPAVARIWEGRTRDGIAVKHYDVLIDE